MQKQDKISIIVPCHNEEEVLPLFLKEIEKIYEVMHANTMSKWNICLWTTAPQTGR